MPIKKYSKEFKQNLLTKLEHYIDSTDMPILAEFTYTNGINRTVLNDFANAADQYREDFSALVKKAIEKKEVYLERNLAVSKVNIPFGIFSLKQLGWRDDYQLPGNKGDSISIEVTGKPAEKLANLMQKRLHSQRSNNIDKRKKMLKSG